MSFVTQEDVFDAIEPVLAGVFREFAKGRKVDDARDSEPAAARSPPVADDARAASLADVGALRASKARRLWMRNDSDETGSPGSSAK
jgi:hypothetical protein